MGKSTEATSLVTRMASEQDPREKTSVKPRYHLDQIADVVLAYRPKPKSKPAKKRARRKKAKG